MHLRTLGGLALEVDGELLTGRAVQKRRLALLTLLAAAPYRTVTRDRVLAMLWPDKDEEQARHLLSVAAYEIRRELGEDVLLTAGDDLVLDPGALTSDLDAFDRAVEEGDLEHAVSLYTGPFLDGFHLGGSVEFDHWADREREARARAFRQALASLAEAMERAGDLTGAVRSWRRLAAEDRYDSGTAIHLLRALHASGNTAGALQFARIHEALLQEEFGTGPSEEFLAAVAEVRGDRVPVASAAVADAAAVAAVAPAETRETPSTEGAAVDGSAEPRSAAASSEQTDGSSPDGSGGAVSPRSGLRVARLGGTPRLVRPLLIVALVLGGVVLGHMASLQTRFPAGPADLGVVVLPFDPMSSDEGDEAFADGLTEEIMDALGKVDGVRVPARSAAFALRGVDAREAARRLGVGYALEGSVRREGDRLRIRVELSGADGFEQWSQQYDRPAGDRFATWEEIAVSVLGALEVELRGEALPRKAGGTSDLLAYDLYLKGRHAWFKRTPNSFSQALLYFEKAVSLDPRYARAYTGIADAYNLLGAYDYGVVAPDAAYPLAKEAAEKALALDPNLAEAHAALGNIRFAYERDWAGAEESYRRAIQLNPRYAEAHHWYALFLIAMGRAGESIDEARQALALDSLSPVMRSSMARQLYFRGDYDGALEHYRSALELDPNFLTAHTGMGLVLIQLREWDEAVRQLQKITELTGRTLPLPLALAGYAMALAGHPEQAKEALRHLEEMRLAGRYVAPEYPAVVRLALGDREGAMDGLEAAYDIGSGSVAFLGVEPLVAQLQGEPRFERLRARVGLP